jgi:hypothetical protein
LRFVDTAFSQALALVAAVATAHWTHDESLAKEIGEPATEEVDVSALSDELISEAEKTGAAAKQDDTPTPAPIADKRYRITFGTKHVLGNPDAENYKMPLHQDWTKGGSDSQMMVTMTGARGVGESAGDSASNAGATVAFAQPSLIEYYVGEAFPYSESKKHAPQLHPGMVPVVGSLGETPCFGRDANNMGKLKHCPGTDAGIETAGKIICEPGSKMCTSVLTLRGIKADEVGKVGYSPYWGTAVPSTNDPDSTMPDDRWGLIQRGQIYGKDVGQITEVEIEAQGLAGSDPAAPDPDSCCFLRGYGPADCWKCAYSPWFPAFIKINSNNPQTGIGNGVYYIQPDGFVGTLPASQTIADTGQAKWESKLLAKPIPVADGNHNAVLKKCVAQVCEEEMDELYGLTTLTDKFLG